MHLEELIHFRGTVLQTVSILVSNWMHLEEKEAYNQLVENAKFQS